MFSRKSAKTAASTQGQVTVQDAITAVQSMAASGTPFPQSVAAVISVLPQRVITELTVMYR